MLMEWLAECSGMRSRWQLSGSQECASSAALGQSTPILSLIEHGSIALETRQKRQLCWISTAMRLIAVIVASPVRRGSLAISGHSHLRIWGEGTVNPSN